MNTYRALENDGLHLGGFGKVFAFMVKYVGPLLILFVEIFGVIGKVKQNGTHYWWVIIFSLIVIVLSIVIYFVFFNNKDTGCNQDELVIEESAKKE